MVRGITKQAWVFVILGAFWILAACGNQAPLVYATVADASLNPGNSVPSPTGEVILNLSGKIGVKNDGNALVFDMATLERFGLVEYKIADPWESKDVTYTGVLMSELIKYAGASASVTTIHMTALDNYEVDITIEDINKWPVLLATRTDGAYMDVDNGGPTRIIFPFGTDPEIEDLIYKNLSIWNIVTMEFR